MSYQKKSYELKELSEKVKIILTKTLTKDLINIYISLLMVQSILLQEYKTFFSTYIN